ncbi:FAD-dependent oxidoreductase [Poseidonocella sp. HB161398]|uniref:FAD-dependent oxidoreductase n=1 Tax=Poseidonocella sp. HB161398 TaxID=2320855 RepID=UPI0011086FC2|nr:FAD-dependent oxidoreductase [Poseidonocella sp. HB161398]
MRNTDNRLVSVLGAGVAGLCTATALADRGIAAELIAPAEAPQPASHFAGGMLAPFCEGEAAPDEVVTAGQKSVDWWAAHVPVARRGTLVVAPPRDAAELGRFARATRGHVPADPGALEPDLEGRFARGLFYETEAHLDPREALAQLRAGLAARGVPIHDGPPSGRIIDCRGLGADLSGLRAVRGEMLIVEAPDVALSRPVRLLHPRFPCYIVPRAGQRFMIGATMVERDDAGPVTARAAMELLSAAYALHPGFAEARILELGAGRRPAFPDNLPRLVRQGDRLHVNGMYRHGFLMAPVLAEAAADQIAHDLQEDIHAH